MIKNSVIVTAYSKAPKNTVMYENNKMMGMVLEIDAETHEIIDVEVTVITDLVKNFFKKILIGINLVDELDVAIERIEDSYITATQTAMVIALKNCRQRYCDAKLSEDK